MSKKVLLIEDDPFIAEIYISNLQSEGIDVDIASDGKTGLEKIEKENPDLIILDLLLPDINGFEILKRVSKKPKKPPVIILTNLVDGENIEYGKKMGAVAYFNKTALFPKEMVKKVKEILESKSRE
jgi:DNA-binding response OmpR family regulator